MHTKWISFHSAKRTTNSITELQAISDAQQFQAVSCSSNGAILFKYLIFINLSCSINTQS